MNRGGSWNNNARNCRVANRNNNTPDNRNNNLGLRLALQLSLAAGSSEQTGKNRTHLLTAIIVIVANQSMTGAVR